MTAPPWSVKLIAIDSLLTTEASACIRRIGEDEAVGPGPRACHEIDLISRQVIQLTTLGGESGWKIVFFLIPNIDCGGETRTLRIDSVEGSGEGDGFADVVEAADPGYYSLYAHAE